MVPSGVSSTRVSGPGQRFSVLSKLRAERFDLFEGGGEPCDRFAAVTLLGGVEFFKMRGIAGDAVDGFGRHPHQFARL